jgi:hypothetical protein
MLACMAVFMPIHEIDYPSPRVEIAVGTRHNTNQRSAGDSAVRKTFKNIMAEYGPLALVIYLTIFAVVLGAFWLGIRFGWRPESVAGDVGTFTAAYIATKLTQPFRIAGTLVLTPLVAQLYNRFRAPAIDGNNAVPNAGVGGMRMADSSRNTDAATEDETPRPAGDARSAGDISAL